jgi:hypothetical protein
MALHHHVFRNGRTVAILRSLVTPMAYKALPGQRMVENNRAT